MSRADAYLQFLRGKIKLAPFSGFDVPLEQVNPALKPHTRDIVRWMVKGGRRACFASFGLHKTATQLEVLRLCGVHRPGLRLQVCPLGVRREFFREVEQRFTGDFAVDLRFIRRDSEIDDPATIYLTNYESIREGNVTPRLFGAASLDEADILRSFGSKTYQEFLPAFDEVMLKFLASATPSPNRFKEIIHYAGFLGVMDTGQALTRFFQRDSEKAGNLTLYPHKVREFWMWVASWAVVITKPSDLGHDDTGYVLPALDVRWHEIESDYTTAGAEKDGQGLLVPNMALGLSAAAREKRDSMPARMAKMAELVAESPDDHFVIWHDLEDERHAIQQAVPEAVSVWGSQELTEREDRIMGFGDGEFRILKPGRIAAVHVKDRVLFQTQTGLGAPTMDYFHEEASAHLRKHGLVKMAIITVTTDVVRENNQTYRLSYSEMLKDGTKMGTGCSEYVLIFRKPQTDLSRGYADEPVRKAREDYSLARWQVDAHNYWRSSGNRLITADEMAAMGPGKLAKFFTDDSLRAVYDYARHVEIGEQLQGKDALPKLFACLQPGSPDPNVWTDVTRMLTLNGEQAQRSVEKHVCPFQFDIVDRCIERYSNKGDVIYDPFHGLGTVGVRAIKLGRRSRGSELSAGYFKDQVHYLQAADREADMPGLFDMLDEPETEAA